MSKFAANTNVSVESSKAEIERTIGRYGAENFASGWAERGRRAWVAFSMPTQVDGGWRHVKIILEFPDPDSREFTHTEGRQLERTPKKARDAWEQACRQKWRALNLVIKAKLEAVESGITSFEEEFLPFLVMPDGETIGEKLLPQIDSVCKGNMPKLLPG